MQITRQANYATRAILHLARAGKHDRVATSAVAREQQIPAAFLIKIISQLTNVGILQTARGRRGGVSLAREPRDITLLQVVEAIDGPIRLNECVTANGTCPFEGDCPMQPVWCDAQKELKARLGSTTFAQLIK
jgi:Rrf2 family protein